MNWKVGQDPDLFNIGKMKEPGDEACYIVLGQLYAWVESTWPAVGTTDRCGQENALLVMFKGQTKTILKPFLADIDGFVVLMSCSDAWKFQILKTKHAKI